MKDLLVAIASLVVLVGGMFLFAASFGLVEDLWDALVGAASRRLPATPSPTPDPEPRKADPPMTDHDDPIRREELARRLAAAEEALSDAEGEVYRAEMLVGAINHHAGLLEERAAALRANVEERIAHAAEEEASLPGLAEGAIAGLAGHTADFQRWRATTRLGLPPRFSPEGYRILDFFDDWGRWRELVSAVRAEVVIEEERTTADALIGVALRLEATARTLRDDAERSQAAAERLRTAEQEAKARYDGIKAELEAAGGPPEPPAD